MLRPRRAPPGMPEVPAFDMTPMIDITFQLIIFFMLIMDMSSSHHPKLQQPSARHAVRDLVEADEVVVNVTAEGQLRVAGKTLSDEGLESLLETQRRTRRADFPVLIRADRSARFELVQKVMMMSVAHGGVSRLRFGAVMEGNR